MKTDEHHESVLAIILSMKKSSAIAEFFEDAEELIGVPLPDRVSGLVREVLDSNK